MKKFVSLIVAVLLICMISIPALAFSYDADTHRISGSYAADGNVEIWVDGSLAGGSNLNVTVSDGNHTIDVYVNGTKVHSETVFAGAPAPTAEPTVEPTEAPTAEPTVEPTTVPTAQPDIATQSPTQVPTPTQQTGGSSSGHSGSDVPKTGEDMSMVYAMVGLMAAAAVVLASRKVLRNR